MSMLKPQMDVLPAEGGGANVREATVQLKEQTGHSDHKHATSQAKRRTG